MDENTEVIGQENVPTPDDERRQANLIQSVIDEKPGEDDLSLLDRLYSDQRLPFVRAALDRKAAALAQPTDTATPTYALARNRVATATHPQTGEQRQVEAYKLWAAQLRKKIRDTASAPSGAVPMVGTAPSDTEESQYQNWEQTQRRSLGTNAFLNTAAKEAVAQTAGMALGGPIGQVIGKVGELPFVKPAAEWMAKAAPVYAPELRNAVSQGVGQAAGQVGYEYATGQNVNMPEAAGRLLLGAVPPTIRVPLLNAIARFSPGAADAMATRIGAGAVSHLPLTPGLTEDPMQAIKSLVSTDSPGQTVLGWLNLLSGGMPGAGSRLRATLPEATMRPEMKRSINNLGIELDPITERIIAITSDETHPQHAEVLGAVRDLAQKNDPIALKVVDIDRQVSRMLQKDIEGAATQQQGGLRRALGEQAQMQAGQLAEQATPKFALPSDESINMLRQALPAEQIRLQKLSEDMLKWKAEHNEAAANVAESEVRAMQNAGKNLGATPEEIAALDQSTVAAIKQAEAEANAQMQGLQTGVGPEKIGRRKVLALKLVRDSKHRIGTALYNEYTNRIQNLEDQMGVNAMTPEEAATFVHGDEKTGQPGLASVLAEIQPVFRDTTGGTAGLLSRVIARLTTGEPLSAKELMMGRRELLNKAMNAPEGSKQSYGMWRFLDTYDRMTENFFAKNPHLKEFDDSAIRPFWRDYRNTDRVYRMFNRMDPIKAGQLLTAKTPMEGETPRGIRVLGAVPEVAPPTPTEAAQVRGNVALQNALPKGIESVPDALVGVRAPDEMVQAANRIVQEKARVTGALAENPVEILAPKTLPTDQLAASDAAARATKLQAVLTERLSPNERLTVNKAVADAIVQRNQTSIKLADGSETSVPNGPAIEEYLNSATWLPEEVRSMVRSVPMDLPAKAKAAVGRAKALRGENLTPPDIAGKPTPDLLSGIVPNLDKAETLTARGAMVDQTKSSYQRALDLAPPEAHDAIHKAVLKQIFDQATEDVGGFKVPSVEKALQIAEANPGLKGPVVDVLRALNDGDLTALSPVGMRGNQKQAFDRIRALAATADQLKEAGNLSEVFQNQYVGKDDFTAVEHARKMADIVDGLPEATPGDRAKAKEALGVGLAAHLSTPRNNPRVSEPAELVDRWNSVPDEAKQTLPPEMKQRFDSYYHFFKNLDNVLSAAKAMPEPTIAGIRRTLSVNSVVAKMAHLGYDWKSVVLSHLLAKAGIDAVVKGKVDAAPRIALADLISRASNVPAQTIRRLWSQSVSEAKNEEERKKEQEEAKRMLGE